MIDDSRRPTRLAGRTNTGRMTRLTRVICHDRKNIAISTRVTLTRLATTDDRMSVNACWAPSTSLFSRLIRAPVWVRVKKEMGIFWIWLNTWERMSKMSPSPTLADTHRSAMERPASDSGQAPGDQGQGDDQPLVVPEDAVVDDVPEDERVDHPDHRVDHDQHHEEDEDVAVRAAEFQHPLGGALGDGLLDDVGVPAHLAQGSAERPAAAGTSSASVHHASDHTVGGWEVRRHRGGGRRSRG